MIQFLKRYWWSIVATGLFGLSVVFDIIEMAPRLYTTEIMQVSCWGLITVTLICLLTVLLEERINKNKTDRS